VRVRVHERVRVRVHERVRVRVQRRCQKKRLQHQRRSAVARTSAIAVARKSPHLFVQMRVADRMAKSADEIARVALAFSYIAHAVLQTNGDNMGIIQLPRKIRRLFASADQCACSTNLVIRSKMMAEAHVHWRLHPLRISDVLH
jgi:hypothetical protein